MKASDDLFQLIHSLSKSEKGYFKKYASKHVLGGENNYCRLFDAILAQKKYDEAALKRDFHDETFIRHLPSEKNYLYHLVLRSLAEYHSESSSEKKIHDAIHAVELLYDKGLYRQALKILARAEKLAQQFEKPLLRLRILEWKSRLLASTASFDELAEFTEQSEKLQEELQEMYRVASGYRRLDEKMLVLSRKIGFPRSKAEKAQYELVMKDPLLKNEKKIGGFWPRYHFYNIRNFYYEALGKTKETYAVRKKLIEHSEEHPDLIGDEQHRYVMALNNLLNSQDELRLYGEAEETIRKLESVETRSLNIRARIFGYTNNIRFTQYILRGDFEKIIAKVPQVEEGLRTYGRLLHTEFHLALKYQFFCGYFGAGKFRPALKWMNEILNDEVLKVRPEIYFFVRIMNLILHFELGNNDLVAYNMRSTWRLFIRQKRLFRFETVMLDFIRKSGNFTTRKSLRNAFIQLKSELEELKKDPYEKQILSFFDILAWLESKISGKKFQEIVQSLSGVD